MTTHDPVALISTPDDVRAWYRCAACGSRQQHERALPAGGTLCVTCHAPVNVSDTIRYASLPTRVLALIVDLAVVPLPTVMLLAAAVFVGLGFGIYDDTPVSKGVLIAARTAVAAYFVVASILCMSVGTWASGLRVVDARTWRRPSLARGTLRTLGIVLTIATVGLGYVAMLFDEERRTLHDRIAGTRVVER